MKKIRLLSFLILLPQNIFPAAAMEQIKIAQQPGDSVVTSINRLLGQGHSLEKINIGLKGQVVNILAFAARQSDTSLFELILEDLRATEILLKKEDENGDRPLIHATRGGNTEVVQSLIRRKAEVDHRNKRAISALDEVVVNNVMPMVKILVPRSNLKDIISARELAGKAAAHLGHNTDAAQKFLTRYLSTHSDVLIMRANPEQPFDLPTKAQKFLSRGSSGPWSGTVTYEQSPPSVAQKKSQGALKKARQKANNKKRLKEAATKPVASFISAEEEQELFEASEKESPASEKDKAWISKMLAMSLDGDAAAQ